MEVIAPLGVERDQRKFYTLAKQTLQEISKQICDVSVHLKRKVYKPNVLSKLDDLRSDAISLLIGDMRSFGYVYKEQGFRNSKSWNSKGKIVKK